MNLRTLRNVSLGLLIVLVLAMVGVAVAIGANYRDRIYPGVTVAGVDLGGLTRGSARAEVAHALGTPEDRSLAVSAGEQEWQLSWSTVGQAHDIDAAVDAAFQVHRDRPWWMGVIPVMASETVDVSTPRILADPASVRTYVEWLAEQVAESPQDAALTLSGGEIIATPARDGRLLDADVATARVLEALSVDADSVVLELTPVSPEIPSAEPAVSELQGLLAQPFTLVVYDPLTGDMEQGGYRADFVAQPGEVAKWLHVVKRDAQYHAAFHVNAIRAWLQTVAPQVGDERALDIDATAARIAQELRATGAHQVQAILHHPPRAYIVQPGDTFFDIAYAHGFPQWQLEKANPDVEPGLIDVGQELAIPSIDVLFPHPLVDGKRIEIDLPTQTLRAYEGTFESEAQVFEFRISSGISTTPTLAGQFQVLFKEEMAFAQRWRLDMPYFMGFYEEGEDFYNGIHELPITSYGVRLSRGVLGWPASYGCIILDIEDAEALYNWAPVGTLVQVHGVAPGTPFGQQTLLDIAPPTPDSAAPDS